MSEFQKTQDRQLALDRRELAATLLSGEVGDRQELHGLARRAGLQRLPDRVLVLQIKHLAADRDLIPQISDQMTLGRLAHLIEDFCQGWTNTLTMIVRPGELCIFTSQDVRNRGHEHITLHEIAHALLGMVRSHGGATARIGISAAHSQPAELVGAYQEACAALDSGAEISFWFSPLS